MRAGARGGSALLITLFFLVLLTILSAGFVTGMRLETTSSHAHLQGMKAGYLAQMGVDAVLARLQTAVGPTNAAWISRPGALAVYGGAWTNIDLSSGLGLTDADSADLNPVRLEDASQQLLAARPLFPGGDPAMRVKWIYVNADATGAMTLVPAAGAGTVGRFAFWADDEASKINLNTAWRHDAANTNALSHPSRVSLAAAGIAQPDNLAAFRASRRINAVEDARAAAGMAGAIDTNAFHLTAYNHSPDLNLFGEPRIVLTTHRTLAEGRPFLDILNADTDDPGLLSSLNTSHVADQVNKLAGQINRTGWPLPSMGSLSLGAKYPSAAYAQQIALDIIEYVRSCESAQPVVEPIRGQLSPASAFSYLADPPLASAVAGNVRGPRFTEFGVYEKMLAAHQYLVRFKLEIHLPSGFGLASIDLSQYHCGAVLEFDDGSHVSTSSSAYISSNPADVAAVPSAATIGTFSYLAVDGDKIVRAGEYRTIVCSGLLAKISNLTGARASLSNSAGKRVELFPTANAAVPYSCDPEGTAESAITTREVDDPSVNKSPADWLPQAANTLGTANSRRSLGTAASPAITPQQDSDAGGNLTDVSMRFPPPKGQPGNERGIVQSVAELGFVHTGIQSVALNVAGIPWRTVRLQPRRAADAAASLPDWLLLDLFAVPQTNPNFFLQPLGAADAFGSVGGRVNLNAAIVPFTNSAGPLVPRIGPLQALFLDAANDAGPLTASAAAALATNVATAAIAQGGSAYSLTNGYVTPGQLAEVRGIADGGEAGEALLRDLADLATVRSGVFSVYAVGQSGRGRDDGTFIVEGERRVCRVVERVPGPGADGAAPHRRLP